MTSSIEKQCNWSTWLVALTTVCLLAGCRTPAAAEANSAIEVPGLVGWVTNGPAVFRLMRTEVTNAVPLSSVWTNPALARLRERQGSSGNTHTGAVFALFLPDSLSHRVWTNLLAHTNGRNTLLWSERAHPSGWPTNPPVVRWNPNSLVHGWRGWTAISPCWEGEVWSGQVPITALTRRHGYTRGHGMGPDGFNANYAGKKAWFVTAQNELVTVKILRQVVRIGGADARSRRDYTIFLFDKDLPAGIEPMGVAQITDVMAKYGYAPGAPIPFFKTEQGGHVSADMPGLTVPTWKGGDSGSPDMLPLPGELVFVGGRSTTGATPEMQEDMDELCRLQKLDPKRYQMRWADLSRFPDYGVKPK